MSHTDPRSAHAHPGGGLDNTEVAHEHSDVNVRALIGFTVGLFVVAAIVHILMWGLFVLFERRAAQNDPPLSPMARPATEMPPNTLGKPFLGPKEGPQLLTNEPAVLRLHRTEEAEALASYGWVNEKGGVARIPVDEAKKLILQRGLPSRAEGTADLWLGTRTGAYLESSGGRTPTQAAPAPEGRTPQTPAPGGHPPATPNTGH